MSVVLDTRHRFAAISTFTQTNGLMGRLCRRAFAVQLLFLRRERDSYRNHDRATRSTPSTLCASSPMIASLMASVRQHHYTDAVLAAPVFADHILDQTANDNRAYYATGGNTPNIVVEFDPLQHHFSV